jgi:hypothetical protein
VVSSNSPSDQLRNRQQVGVVRKDDGDIGQGRKRGLDRTDCELDIDAFFDGGLCWVVAWISKRSKLRKDDSRPLLDPSGGLAAIRRISDLIVFLRGQATMLFPGEKKAPGRGVDPFGNSRGPERSAARFPYGLREFRG